MRSGCKFTHLSTRSRVCNFCFDFFRDHYPMLEIRVTRLGRFGQISVDCWLFNVNFVKFRSEHFGNNGRTPCQKDRGSFFSGLDARLTAYILKPKVSFAGELNYHNILSFCSNAFCQKTRVNKMFVVHCLAYPGRHPAKAGQFANENRSAWFATLF